MDTERKKTVNHLFINYLIVFSSVVLATLVFSYALIKTSNADIDEKNFLISKLQSLENLAGDTSVKVNSPNAFSLNSANMSSRRKGDFLVGNDFFEDPWVIAPSSTKVRDGLGPLFNVSSCQSCHINDGSGHAPIDEHDDIDTLLIRLSKAVTLNEYNEFAQIQPDSANIADENYGGQIQDRAIAMVDPEMRIRIRYEDKPVQFKDGEVIQLRQPMYTFDNLNYGELSDDSVLSPRLANQMIGLGLLEVIDENEIIELAKKQASVDDGISGKANRVWDIEKSTLTLGRFGWKAGQPNVKQQVAAAFNGDIGITNSLFTKDHCLETQTDCLKVMSGNDKESQWELRDDILDFVSFYARNLAVPSRRNIDNENVKKGAAHFVDANCQACHQPSWQTPKLDDDYIEQSQQVIWPFSDMLLHDMGEDLADFNLKNQAFDDNVANEFQATAREWRTAPLWGIGLRKTIDDQANFLHDGRARTIEEAIVWHGGEAKESQQYYLNMDKQQRQELLEFLNSL